MKKVLLTMLTLLAAGSMWAQTAGTAGSLNVPNVNRKGGPVPQTIIVEKSSSRKGVAKIQLAGSENCRDLQFDLTLPEGISLVTEPTTENPVVMVEATDANHVLFYALDGNTVKIAVVDKVAALDGEIKAGEVENASSYGQYLANDIVFELPIKANAAFTGVKDATIANLAFTDDAAVADITAAGTTFGIALIKLGDVTDDGEVDISDAQALVSYCFDNPPSVFVEEVADLTDNTEIDISDAQALVSKLFEDSSSAKPFIEEVVENEVDPE